MRWASAVETDSNLSSAIERAAGKVFAGLGRQEPDLVFVFVGADHAPRFDAVTDLLRASSKARSCSAVVQAA